MPIVTKPASTGTLRMITMLQVHDCWCLALIPEVTATWPEACTIQLVIGNIAMDQSAGKRKHKRLKMVLPLRVWTKPGSDETVFELAHTLDITPRGARLGAIHHSLNPGDKLVVQYRQRKIQFRVVWVHPMDGTSEFQVGVEALEGGETWGLELDNTSIDITTELVNS